MGEWCTAALARKGYSLVDWLNRRKTRSSNMVEVAIVIGVAIFLAALAAEDTDVVVIGFGVIA